MKGKTVTKTVTAPHLLPTDDLRTRLDREVGGLTVTLKNRGLDWLFYDLDGRSIVAHFFPAQSLLNIHAGGSARPTFQATGVAPDDIPPLLRKHLERDEGDGNETEAEEIERIAGPQRRESVPVESDLSERQRELLFRVVVAMASNPGHAGWMKADPLAFVKTARDIVLHATNIKAQDGPESD
jgi:hypothetical protein